MDYVFSVLLIVLFIKHLRLSRRVRKYERIIYSAVKSSTPSEMKASVQPPLKPPPLPIAAKAGSKKEALKALPKPKPKNVRSFRPTSIALNKIKENWMGVFGSAILVIGAVFFGLTAKVMKVPEFRVGVMIAVSCVFLGVSQRLKNRSDWAYLSGWLKSIAGAVILFATLGAGMIEGLRFIQNPLYVTVFLCVGIAVNLSLALTTPFQGIASLHVILSILAFCVAPQSPMLLPIGALVASTGLIAAYRSKWDLQLLFIISAFAFQNAFWTLSMKEELLPWMHFLAIGSSLFVSFVAAFVHYRKKYQVTKLEVLPLIAHSMNWILLIGNIALHMHFSKVIFFVLAGVAVIGFSMARIAKKKEISWLYQTDKIFSQIVCMAAIVSLCSYSVKPMDLALLLVIEIFVFNYISRHHKENLLLRVGCLFFYASLFVTAFFILNDLISNSTESHFAIYLRMLVVTALCWGFHLTGLLRGLVVDDFQYLLFLRKKETETFSITAFIGSLFLMGMYCYGFQSIWAQVVVLSAILLLRRKEDPTWDFLFFFCIVSVHCMNWYMLSMLAQKTSPLHLLLCKDFIGIILVDLLLLFGNMLQFKLWKKNLHDLVIFALGIQIGTVTYVFMAEVSALLPGFAFLAYSIIALESRRWVSITRKFNAEIKLKIRDSLTFVGLASFFVFLWRFITVHLQVDPIWNGISLLFVTEIIALLIIIYWMVFYDHEVESPKLIQALIGSLTEIFLGLISLCVFVDMPDTWRPVAWMVIAIGTFVGVQKYRWPVRLYLYSWGYLVASIVHVAFVTYNLTMPSLFAVEKYNIPVCIAIFMQIYFCYIVHAMKISVKKSKGFSKDFFGKAISTLYGQPSLSFLLPVFMGIALFFAFNFEKAVLTLLWVGLFCVYLVVGLLVKSKQSIQIAMGALIICCVRLILFDMKQSDPAVRAGVFIGVGILLLGASVLYKKYKRRVETNEKN